MALVCPQDGAVLHPVSKKKLVCEHCSAEYPIRAEIPRFVYDTEDAGQAQVRDCYSFKWKRSGFGYGQNHLDVTRRFFCERFGFESENEIGEFFENKTVLHAGIVNGQVEQL